MPLEIERKFLVCGDFKPSAFDCERITQGYLSSLPERNVRVRIKGEKAYLTIKGEGNASGTSRFEWEKEISVADAELLLAICEPGIIDKQRYYVASSLKQPFEVDVFCGENEGLIVAEIELNYENEVFEKPSWLGKEVTGIDSYYNAMLSKKPYTKW